MIRNLAGQVVGAGMVNATTGGAYVGTVTVYIDIDGGSQVLGSVGSGVCTAQGNGLYTYAPTAAETNGAFIAYTFIGTGAIPQTIPVATLTAGQQAAFIGATGASSISVTDLLTGALKRINEVAAGETATPEDLSDAFQMFGDFIDSMANERLTMYTIGRTPWTLTSGKGAGGASENPYTLGLTGDINIARPLYIDHITYMDNSVSPELERPLFMLTDDAYAAVPQKDLTSPLPTNVYVRMDFPLAKVFFWYVPTNANLQGVVYYPVAVSRYNSLTDTVALPPGYNRFLRENMALELWPMFREGVPVDPMLVRSAELSKDAVKMANQRPMDLSLDPAYLIRSTGRRYSILSDN